MPHSYIPRKRPSKPPSTNDHVLAYLVTIALICILSLGIPLAAILPPRFVAQLPINILVPLYTSPVQGAWDALYSAVIEHCDRNFTVIISPDNGPGPPPYPADEYISAINRINIFSNVQTIGYIDTSRGTQKPSTVLEQIETYASWVNTTGLAMHGIFFDQTPFEDTTETSGYLRDISAAVKHAEGIQWPRLVVHNPGVVPILDLTSGLVDVTVVYEGKYGDVESREGMKRRLAKMPGDRTNYAMVVHSLPKEIGRGELRKLINGVRQNAEYLLITTLEEEYGKGFGSKWSEFLSLTW